jgi:hypothetical protein
MQHRLFNAHEKKTVLSLGFGLLIVILLLCSCGSTGVSSTASPITTKQSTGITAATTEQSAGITATAVTTKVPSNTISAVLGGSPNAFTAKYGQPNDHSGNGELRFERCNNSKWDQLSLSQISLESKSGPIASIVVLPCPPASWSLAQANAICSAFLPPDAKYQRSVQVANADKQGPSVDKIYYSATLAHTFAADNFTDNNDALVQPGLLDVNYFYVSNSDTSHVNVCDLELGDSQTAPDSSS